MTLIVALLARKPARRVSAEERYEAWERCSGLAVKAKILDEFASELSRVGVVGELRAGKFIYLAVTSRLLDRLVSVAVKGPSSGGKSFVVESTLKFFPPEAFYALTAMSDRALAYSSESLKHRHLVIYEAAGMASDFATYLIRSLLSEGRVDGFIAFTHSANSAMLQTTLVTEAWDMIATLILHASCDGN